MLFGFRLFLGLCKVGIQLLGYRVALALFLLFGFFCQLFLQLFLCLGTLGSQIFLGILRYALGLGEQLQLGVKLIRIHAATEHFVVSPHDQHGSDRCDQYARAQSAGGNVEHADRHHQKQNGNGGQHGTRALGKQRHKDCRQHQCQHQHTVRAVRGQLFQIIRRERFARGHIGYADTEVGQVQRKFGQIQTAQKAVIERKHTLHHVGRQNGNARRTQRNAAKRYKAIVPQKSEHGSRKHCQHKHFALGHAHAKAIRAGKAAAKEHHQAPDQGHDHKQATNVTEYACAKSPARLIGWAHDGSLMLGQEHRLLFLLRLLFCLYFFLFFRHGAHLPSFCSGNLPSTSTRPFSASCPRQPSI